MALFDTILKVATLAMGTAGTIAASRASDAALAQQGQLIGQQVGLAGEAAGLERERLGLARETRADVRKLAQTAIGEIQKTIDDDAVQRVLGIYSAVLGGAKASSLRGVPGLDSQFDAIDKQLEIEKRGIDQDTRKTQREVADSVSRGSGQFARLLLDASLAGADRKNAAEARSLTTKRQRDEQLTSQLFNEAMQVSRDGPQRLVNTLQSSAATIGGANVPSSGLTGVAGSLSPAINAATDTFNQQQKNLQALGALITKTVTPEQEQGPQIVFREGKPTEESQQLPPVESAPAPRADVETRAERQRRLFNLPPMLLGGSSAPPS